MCFQYFKISKQENIGILIWANLLLKYEVISQLRHCYSNMGPYLRDTTDIIWPCLDKTCHVVTIQETMYGQ